MKIEDVDLADKGNEVVKTIEHLNDETDVLSDLNDDPHLQHEEVEGVVAAVIRVLMSIFKL